MRRGAELPCVTRLDGVDILFGLRGVRSPCAPGRGKGSFCFTLY